MPRTMCSANSPVTTAASASDRSVFKDSVSRSGVTESSCSQSLRAFFLAASRSDRNSCMSSPHREPLDREIVRDRPNVIGTVGDRPPGLRGGAAVARTVVGDQADAAFGGVSYPGFEQKARVWAPAMDQEGAVRRSPVDLDTQLSSILDLDHPRL